MAMVKDKSRRPIDYASPQRPSYPLRTNASDWGVALIIMAVIASVVVAIFILVGAGARYFGRISN